MKGNANFFGIESCGVMQVRGNGILLISDTDLVFGMFQPKHDFRLPFARIENIELAESHLTKTVFQPRAHKESTSTQNYLMKIWNEKSAENPRMHARGKVISPIW